MTNNEIALSVIDALSTKDGETVVSFDFDGLKEVITNLQAIKKGMKEEADAAAKAKKAEVYAKTDEIGKKYYDSLAIGDTFSILNSKGETVELIKIETKSASGKSAAGELVNPPADAKTTKRYPKFRQIILPTVN